MQQPYYKQQAAALLETGKCELPLTWDDVANRVAKHETFAYAIKQAYEGNPRVLQMLTIAAANNLCREQDSNA